MDTLGLILKVVVHPADMQDREGGKLVLDGVKKQYPKLEKVWADQGYTGGFLAGLKTARICWSRWSTRGGDRPSGTRQTSLRSVDPRKTFHVLPRRWVVERTFAWLGKCRRLSKDYEALPETTENLVYLAMIRLMLRRLVRIPP